MKKQNLKTITIFLFLLLTATCFSQQTFGQKVDIATAREEAEAIFKNEEYDQALALFLKLSQKDTADLYYNYRIGLCYLNLNFDKSLAIPYLDYVSRAEKEFLPNVYFFLGFARLHAHQFQLAILTFNLYKSYVKKDELKRKAQRYIEMCQSADSLTQFPVDVTFENLGKNINSKYADFNPFVNSNETLLAYSSDRNGHQSDIFVSTRKKERVFNKSKAPEEINTSYDEIVAGLTKKGDKIYIHTNEFSPLQDITFTTTTNGKFSEVQPFEHVNTQLYAEHGISISNNEDSLFFASNRPDGYGGFDIYLSLKLPNGSWGIPMNMGTTINTEEDENYPSISYDARTLHYASKGYNSMGGYDIFSTTIDSVTGNWTEPKNLGFPVNTTYNDRTICVVPGKPYAYIASIREEGMGDYDLYKVTFNNMTPNYLIIDGTISIGDSINKQTISITQEEITITVRNTESNQIFGIYTYNRKSGKYIITFIPGKYELIIEGESVKTFKKKFRIIDVVGGDVHQKFDILLQRK